MENLSGKIEKIIDKLQAVVEKNQSLEKQIVELRSKSEGTDTKDKNVKQTDKGKKGNVENGMTESERLEIKKKIKNYIHSIDGILDKMTS